jgi:hypothetical protein
MGSPTEPKATSTPDRMVEGLLSKSPEDRGLCNDCARFNWAYHLTRFDECSTRDSAFEYKDTFIDGYIQNHQPVIHARDYISVAAHFRFRASSPVRHPWYHIEDVPYSGLFWINKEKSQTIMTLERYQDLDPSLHTEKRDTPYVETDQQISASSCKTMRAGRLLSGSWYLRYCSFCRLIYDCIHVAAFETNSPVDLRVE